LFGDSSQAWNSVSEFQQAYAIGKAEAAAAMNLLKEVDVRISAKLMQLVKFLVTGLVHRISYISLATG